MTNTSSSPEQQPDVVMEIENSADRSSTVQLDDQQVPAASVGAAGIAGVSSPGVVTGRLSDVWRLVTRNGKVTLGTFVALVFVLIALLGPVFLHADPNAFGIDSLAPPSADHWLGTTQTGQDVFTQVIIGARSSVTWGLVTGVLVTLISIVLGLTAGYFGGVIDDIISVIINVFLLLPGFPLAIVLAAFFPWKGSVTVTMVLVITGWAYGARVLRAQTMSLRNRDFVEAARSSGEHTWRIIFFEILPNQISIVAGNLIGAIVYALLAAAGLEFLGLGDPNNVSWGVMLFWAQNNDAILLGAWWWFLPPGLCIAFLSAALSLINFGMDEVANPRLRKEPKVKVAKEKKAVAA
ncbi:ABC transporter permease [Tengunoibacter tsumagoiensis]|uniref:ABC transmembrane type-1 domain-containing protein n=1 Tax=Tengunoibacter tsumagoiensis TaxID=2014871 RepID=A0A402AA19_9CHLR|nr:ABC transporter permease [Tengunoibacter tsumagoiensis]GCE15990.1 hypothetical protein KTT_58490 [Tengunoibacter tsumagoiensis]